MEYIQRKEEMKALFIFIFFFFYLEEEFLVLSKSAECRVLALTCLE